MTNFGILLFLAVPMFCLPVHQSSAVESTTTSPLSNRQVGDGVTGNQTGSSGSITNSGGPGDGNGVAFAGTGSDIDTGDDFDIGDGNNAIGDGNVIEIGDRINDITNINVGPNNSRIGNTTTIPIQLSGMGNGSGGNAMNFNINLRLIVDGKGNVEVNA
ncbi:hypothetical protein LA080_002945 [Diaporthe eres]|nr:hypothetical protein LA080_002945 [Diaporthe eres]